MAGGEDGEYENGPFVPDARPTNLERLSSVPPDARGLVRAARVRWPVARLHDSVRAAFYADDTEAPQSPRSVRRAGRPFPEGEARARRPARDAPDRSFRHRGSSTAVDPPDPLPVSDEYRELPVAELRAVRPTHAGGRKAASGCPTVSEGSPHGESSIRTRGSCPNTSGMHPPMCSVSSSGRTMWRSRNSTGS